MNYFDFRILTAKPQVEQTLSLKHSQTKAKSSITWFFVNTTLLAIVVFDM